MMSEALARHLLECVLNDIDVAFNVGREQITLRHVDGGLRFYQKFGGFPLSVADIDIVEGYLRIETADGILIGFPFEEARE